MARLTDEELERLLRETFADKEKLADSLPKATKSRRPVAPVLLAAAAVLVVLGGILYGVNRGGDADPAPPVAVAPAGDDAEIWGAAITAITHRLQPKYDLRSLLVRDQTAELIGTQRAGNVRAFSAAQKERIADRVSTATHIEVKWVDAQPHATTETCFRELANVSVGEVFDKGDHKEVRTSIAYNCGYSYVLTYRVEKQNGVWTVTGTVGPGEGSIPAGCPMSGESPASPRDGC